MTYYDYEGSEHHHPPPASVRRHQLVIHVFILMEVKVELVGGVTLAVLSLLPTICSTVVVTTTTTTSVIVTPLFFLGIYIMALVFALCVKFLALRGTPSQPGTDLFVVGCHGSVYLVSARPASFSMVCVLACIEQSSKDVKQGYTRRRVKHKQNKTIHVALLGGLDVVMRD